MNLLKPTHIGILLSICFIYSGATMADTPSNTGVIILRDKDNAICTLPMPAPGKLEYFELSKHGQGSCAPNTARSIQLAEVSSATIINLWDYPRCQNTADDEFRIGLRTTQKKTSTPIIEIEYITTFKEGVIVTPGLLLTRKYVRHGGTARDNLDCIVVQTSHLPSP